MHQVHTVVDYCTKCEQIWKSTNSLLRYCNKHIKVKKNIVIFTQIWNRAKYYFTCITNTWYLITIRNMNKINPFFSAISQQMHKMYNKVAIITQIWYRPICNFTGMSNAWYLITVQHMNKITTFFSKILQQTLKIYDKIAIITQIWHRASAAHGTWSWYPIWRKSIQPSWGNARGRLNRKMDRPMDWTLSYIPRLIK